MFKFSLIAFVILIPLPGFALQPEEVLLIANQSVVESVELAEEYRQKRKIPQKNLLLVRMVDTEGCSREEYREQLIAPLRALLKNRQPNTIRCVLLFYGLPLRIAAAELSQVERQQLEQLKFKKKSLDFELKNLSGGDLDRKAALEEAQQGLLGQIKALRRFDEQAALDSELAFALVDKYQLSSWLPNPYFVGNRQRQDLPIDMGHTLLVARLDGPTPAIVRRMLNDSLKAEAHGLKGRAYFDARGAQPKDQNGLKGYAYYDNSLHLAAEITEQQTLKQQLNVRFENLFSLT